MARILKIPVVLTNRIAQFIPPYPDKLKEIFGYVSPSAFFHPLYKKFNSDGERIWNGIVSFLKYDRVPSGLFLSMREKIEKEWDVKFQVMYSRKKPKFTSFEPSDRHYQNECILAMRKASKCGGIITSATGTGKTRIAGMFFKSLVGSGVFIVDELGLLKQAQLELQEVLKEEVGYIGNMKFIPKRITVATAQTVHRHRNDPKFKPWHKSLDVVIIDEIHEMLGKRNHEIVSALKPKACFGLTATLQHKKKPIRMKAQALTGPIIYQFPLKEGVRKKYLTPGVVIGVNMVRSGHKQWSYWEEYDKLVACSKRFNDMVERITRSAVKRNKFVLQLVKRPKHVKILSKRMKGIPHRCAYGAIKVKDRMGAKYSIEQKHINLIIANQVFKKGTNIKRVDFIIDAACLPSHDDCQQKYGRGVRLCSDKDGLIYIDVGYKNPPGVDKQSSFYNRFASGTRKRRKALKQLSVPVFEMDWNGSGKEVLKFALKKLRYVLAEMDKGR